MSIPLSPTRPIEMTMPLFVPGEIRAEPRADRRVAFAAGVLGFFCFMPYPAMSMGSQSALQIGSVLTILMCLPILGVSWRRKSYHLYWLLMIPSCLALMKVGTSGDGDAGICLRAVVARFVPCMTLLATQYYAPMYALEMLTGIALATVTHFAVGLWQMYCFTQGEFPLVELYVNSSFLSVQDMAKTIANYIQRPFGIFPEPSAMSSSLAPWVLFWIAELCGFVRLRREPARWQRALFGMGAAGGLLLIILSRSGHTMVTLLPVVLFAGMWLVRSRATARNYLIIVSVCCVVLPLVLWLGAEAMSDRLGGKSDVGNSSWEERSSSLYAGFMVLTHGSVATLIFGIGPGLCAPIAWGSMRLDAVWSVLLNYVYETGLIGAAAVGWVAQYLWRTWRSQRFSLVFASIGFVWFVGVLLTTSYEQLLPIWVALGWLTAWPAICRAKGEEAPEAPVVVEVRASTQAEGIRASRPPLRVVNPRFARGRKWSES